MKIIRLEDKTIFMFDDKEIIMNNNKIQEHHLEYMTYEQLCTTGKDVYKKFMEEVRK